MPKEGSGSGRRGAAGRRGEGLRSARRPTPIIGHYIAEFTMQIAKLWLNRTVQNGVGNKKESPLHRSPVTARIMTIERVALNVVVILQLPRLRLPIVVKWFVRASTAESRTLLQVGGTY